MRRRMRMIYDDYDNYTNYRSNAEDEMMMKEIIAEVISKQYRRATALRRTLYKMPGLINQRHAFLEIIK